MKVEDTIFFLFYTRPGSLFTPIRRYPIKSEPSPGTRRENRPEQYFFHPGPARTPVPDPSRTSEIGHVNVKFNK